jgi:type III pantothenate kinase
VSFVESARRLGAVTTRYAEPWRLGADRLVAAIGAFAIAGRRGACVVDVGTAMTVDLVDSQGVHRGGVIVPGPQLMVSSLLEETDGIGKRAGPAAARRRRPAASEFFVRATRDAVETGARFAAAAAIDRAVLESRASLGRMPLVLLTGGAAPLVAPLLRTRRVRHVPDLVLQGLAVLAKSALR